MRGKSTARPAQASKQYDTDTTSSAWLEQLDIHWVSHTKFNFNISLLGQSSVVANKKTLLLLSVSLFICKALEKCRIFTSQLCKEKKKEKKIEKKRKQITVATLYTNESKGLIFFLLHSSHV